jgi:hypothetical protein
MVEGENKDARKRVEESNKEKGKRQEPKKDAGKGRQVYRYIGRQESAPTL